MKKGLLFAVVLVASGLLFGGQPVCKEQVFVPPPETMDVNQLEVDPVSGERLLVKTYAAVVGQPYMMVGYACDPDPNETLRAWRLPEGPELVLDAEGAFVITFTPAAEGWTYFGVAVTDGLLERRGTYAVWSRVNHPPSLCGGRP